MEGRRALSVFMVAFLTGACHGGAPTVPSTGSGQVSSTPVAPRTPVAAPFRLTGIVTDHRGRPLGGATVWIDFASSSAPGSLFSQISTVAAADGRYTAEFVAVPGAMAGPAGTASAVAITWTSFPGYDADVRYTLGTDRVLVQDFQLEPMTRLTAGESVSLVVDANAPVCSNDMQDMHPWPTEFICRSVHVIAPRDGIVTAEVSSASGAARTIEMQTVNAAGPCCGEQLGNPVSIAVAAGTELLVSVELPWGAPTDASIVLKTSMSGK